MPTLAQAQAALNHDRVWAAYALADLQPALQQHCAWWLAEDGVTLALRYAAFDPPVLYVQGAPPALRPLLAQVTDPQVFVLAQAVHLPALAERWPRADLEPMWRMALTAAPAPFTPTAPVRQLTPADLPAIRRLIDSAPGDGPDFFTEAALMAGVYYGHSTASDLLAMAGTHVLDVAGGVAAIGNVYTRADQRGRGLASACTHAVISHLRRLHCRTIVLNVSQHNPAAERVYARLGFTRHCAFWEGAARRAH